MSYSIPHPRYTLDNPPSISQASFILEQDFLRHVKTGVIQSLEEYLKQLNVGDWTCLLAENPRKEFFKYLPPEIKEEIDWKYVIARQGSIEQDASASNENANSK